MNPGDRSVLEQVGLELKNARDWHAPFAGRHEAIAVIREEYLELEGEVFRGVGQGMMHAEAIQLAAMCVRLVIDLPNF